MILLGTLSFLQLLIEILFVELCIIPIREKRYILGDIFCFNFFIDNLIQLVFGMKL